VLWCGVAAQAMINLFKVSDRAALFRAQYLYAIL
jgi:hypothetical protein